jgi:hypothetical protein
MTFIQTLLTGLVYVIIVFLGARLILTGQGFLRATGRKPRIILEFERDYMLRDLEGPFSPNITERREAEKRGRAVESDELISAALDAVARDYFQRAVLRAVSRRAR